MSVGQRLADVSEHNGSIDWTAYARDSEAVYVRIADGDHRDTLYSKARVQAIRKAALKFGVYYFGRVASAGNKQRDGKAEAQMAIKFAREMGWGKDDLRFAYDFEVDNGQPAEKCARHLMEFLAEAKKILGHRVVIYTMRGFFTTISPHLSTKEKEEVAKHPLWLAEWGVSRPAMFAPWSTYALWQFTDDGPIAGAPRHGDVSHPGPEADRLLTPKGDK